MLLVIGVSIPMSINQSLNLLHDSAGAVRDAEKVEEVEAG